MMTKVSVIIPTYNVEQYLGQCLDSVVNQTLKDIEIVCVDDGSSDNSLQILKDYAAKDNRIYVFQQKNQGAGAARNLGIEHSNGDYLYFMDGDDYLELDALEKVYQRITDKNADICVFKNGVYHQSTGVLESCRWENSTLNVLDKETFNKYSIPEDLYLFCNVPAWIKMYKTSFIKDKNLKFQNLRVCNDVYFNYMTLSLADSITFLDETLITWRTEHSCTTATRGKYISCVLEAYKAIKNDLSKEDFKLLSDTFYRRAKRSFVYEIGKVEDSKEREYWKKRLLNFLPRKYRQGESYTLLERIFSIKNKDIYKIVCIAGIELKFESKKLIERKQYRELQNSLNNEFEESDEIQDNLTAQCSTK